MKPASLALSHLDYFQQFDEIKMYYDGGQAQLGRLIDDAFGKLIGYHREDTFDHQDKKLFQVADMLTYVDKVIHKYDNGIKFSNTERTFFGGRTVERTKKELRGHRF